MTCTVLPTGENKLFFGSVHTCICVYIPVALYRRTLARHHIMTKAPVQHRIQMYIIQTCHLVNMYVILYIHTVWVVGNGCSNKNC